MLCTYICCVCKYKDTKRLKIKIWENTFLVNSNQKWAGLAMLLWYKIALSQKVYKRDREGYPRLIKIQDITTIYSPTNRVQKYKKKTDRIKERNEQFYNNTWGFQYPTLSND